VLILIPQIKVFLMMFARHSPQGVFMQQWQLIDIMNIDMVWQCGKLDFSSFLFCFVFFSKYLLE